MTPKDRDAESKAPKSVTYLTPEDLVPLQAQLDDHEERIAALEAGEGANPQPPEPGAATLVLGTWYSQMDRFDELAAAGFTHAHEWAYPDRGSLGYLDAAHAHGLKVFLELSWAMEGNVFHADRLDMMMCPEYSAHPAFVGWLAYDEPDLRQTPVAEMQKIYDAIKRKDPHHPVKLTIRYPWKDTGRPYLPFGDIIAVDPYPIQYGPPEQAGSETAEAVAAITPKPTWTDVQTFSWGGTFPENEPGRIPTIEEVEIMGTTSLQAQTHRDKGLYCYLEDEIWNDAELREGIGEAVDAWRACVPGAAVAVAPTSPKRGPFPPLPTHPAIDALKARMREEKRRHYPRPTPR